ncbi:MAG: cadmium-translocating P-type ATPase [Defluviitaleaceae bacterium]|nr:cadmium-translocating P-type ATPase [Defluviitaleaceae bacterium]
MKKVFVAMKTNYELVLALLCGALILCAWLLQTWGVLYSGIALYVLAYLVGGFVKTREGFLEAIKEKDLNVDILMMLAAIGAAIIGYWGEGAMLIFIFSLAGAMETYTFNKSHKEISALMDLQPETAIRLVDGKEEEVAVGDLHIGDIILVKPGERIPADGSISLGETNVDESAITGESIPNEKGVGDEVFASTVNMRGSIQVKINKPSDQTLFQRIIRLVQNAQSEKSPSQLLIERFEGPYAKIVIAVSTAVILLGYFAFGMELSAAVYRGLVLLVVASPCALVASITPATLSAISNGARSGILFKGGVQLERLASLKVIAFDKTGTLTKGKPVVTDIYAKKGMTEKELMEITSSIESHSTHPLADAIINHAKRQYDITVTAPTLIENVVGFGVKGEYDGKSYKIGKADFVSDAAEDFNDNAASRLQKEGKTIVFIGDDEGIVGLIALKDTIRPETIDAIASLKEIGIESAMITGDNEQTAKVIAEESGLTNYYASCLPETKVDVVKELKEKYQTVAMVGDGINDAPALATADIGIAMGEGTDVALETADVVLMKNNLGSLSKAVGLSKRLKVVTRQNIIFAISIMMLFAVANFITAVPIPLAVIAHEGSTILVILNGLRLLRSKKAKVMDKRHVEALGIDSCEGDFYKTCTMSIEKCAKVAQGGVCPLQPVANPS